MLAKHLPQYRHAKGEVETEHPVDQVKFAVMLNQLFFNYIKVAITVSDCFSSRTRLIFCRPSRNKRVIHFGNHGSHAAILPYGNADLFCERNERQGARSTESETYHADRRAFEHRATQDFARAVNKSVFPYLTPPSQSAYSASTARKQSSRRRRDDAS